MDVGRIQGLQPFLRWVCISSPGESALSCSICCIAFRWEGHVFEEPVTVGVSSQQRKQLQPWTTERKNWEEGDGGASGYIAGKDCWACVGSTIRSKKT